MVTGSLFDVRLVLVFLLYAHEGEMGRLKWKTEDIITVRMLRQGFSVTDKSYNASNDDLHEVKLIIS